MKTKAKLNRNSFLQAPLLRASEARAAGIEPAMLAYWEKKGILERMNRGLYRNKQIQSDIPFEWEDLVYTTLSIPHGVVAGISALALYGLTEEIPRFHWIAVPNGTSVVDHPNTKILRLRNHALGITQIKVGSIEVPIYDIERTLVDAFRLLSIEAAIKALKEAFKPQQKRKPDLRKISAYAKKLRVDIQPYILMVTT